jgi:hypothetical protein
MLIKSFSRDGALNKCNCTQLLRLWMRWCSGHRGVLLVRPIFSLAVGAILIATSLPAATGETARPAGVEPGHADEVSAAKRKKRSSGQQAYGHGGTQIACTQYGCNPIPPGCRIRTGYNPWTWDPTGFDEVVCPYRR